MPLCMSLGLLPDEACSATWLHDRLQRRPVFAVGSPGPRLASQLAVPHTQGVDPARRG
jgi:hypothetical protein